MVKVYAMLIILGLLGGVGYGGYSYYKDTQERIATLTANNAKLETAAKLQEETINTMIEDREEMQKIQKGLHKKLRVAETYGDQLRNTLRKHNLTHLANKKPSYIERKMQNATNRLWGCLADITDPDRVQQEDRSKSSNCHKGSKTGSSNSSKTKASPAK